jgi:hypothetical protein
MRGPQSVPFVDLISIHPGTGCSVVCGPSSWTRLFPSPCGATHDAGLMAAAGRWPSFPSSPHPAPQPLGRSLPPMSSRPATYEAYPRMISHMHAALTGSLACPSPSTRCVDSDSMPLQFDQWPLPSPHDYIDYRLIVIDCTSSFPWLL